MKRSQKQFLELLSASLNQRAPRPDLFREGCDWNRVYDISLHQSMAAVVYDAITDLPPELQPDPRIYNKFFFSCVKTEQSHLLMNEVLTELVEYFRSNGLDPILLKGQGMAANYPVPNHRVCGDIDFCFADEEYERAYLLCRKFGLTNKSDLRLVDHLDFDYKSVHVELHRPPEIKCSSLSAEKLFQSELFGNSRMIDINGTSVRVPSVTYDAIFIFHHLYRHFNVNGVGFRQLCDWHIHIEKFRKSIEMDKLRIILNGLQDSRFWDILGSAGEKYLGFSFRDFRNLYKPYDYQIRSAISLIFFYGNFGYKFMSGKDGYGYYSGKMVTAFNRFRILLSKINLTGTEAVTEYMRSVSTGISNTIAHK